MQIINLSKVKLISTNNHIFVIFSDSVEVFEYSGTDKQGLSSSPIINSPSRASQCQSFITNNRLRGLLASSRLSRLCWLARRQDSRLSEMKRRVNAKG